MANLINRLNHKYLIISAVRVGLIATLVTQGFSFPIRQFSNPYCQKGVHRTQLPESCKEELQKDGTLDSKSPLFDVQTLIFSAIRGASYDQATTTGTGSHPSLDIVSAEGTPVYAIEDGVVINARERAGFGNSVTVQHKFNDTYIYSNYSHLEQILVSQGQIVNEEDVVGTVGRTGFTIGPFGYHLDFQITTDESPSHPYGLHDCDIVYYDAVNQRACRDKVERYTINPEAFFAQYGDQLTLSAPQNTTPILQDLTNDESPEQVSSINALTIKQYLEEQKNKRVAEEAEVYAPRPLIEAVANALPEVYVPTPTGAVDILTTPTERDQSVYTAPVVVQQPVDQPVVLPVDINRSVFGDTIRAGSYVPITFTVNDLNGNPVNTKLDEQIRLEVTSNNLKLFPSKFSRIVQGKKTLVALPQQPGVYGVAVYYGQQNIGAFDLTVQ